MVAALNLLAFVVGVFFLLFSLPLFTSFFSLTLKCYKQKLDEDKLLKWILIRYLNIFKKQINMYCLIFVSLSRLYHVRILM